MRTSIKLLVFAATPPPHHGQSYAVQTMLAGLNEPAPNGSSDLKVFHVNCRFSEGIDEVGRFRYKKITLLLGYCAQALWLRFRYGVKNLYYVPAPGQRTPLYRDWLVMLLCRPFFRQTIFHWHATGLGAWLDSQAKPWERWVSRILLGRNNLSIVLGEPSRVDAAKLKPRASLIVANGIADPCPDFERELKSIRLARRAARQKLLLRQPLTAEEASQAGKNPHLFQVLFLVLCSREKGLFDCLDAVVLLNQKLKAEGTSVRATLRVAGGFPSSAERAAFEARVKEHGLQFISESAVCPEQDAFVKFCGFASGEEKRRLFIESDVFCFPTYYSAEGFPLVLLEAMAYELPIISTRWRSIPEMLPEDYPGLVEPKDPERISDALEKLLHAENPPALRTRFLNRFTEAHYIGNMREAIVHQLRP